VRVVVLADTHIRRGSSRRLPDVVYEELDRCDAILHAGDFVVPSVIDELSGFAPVHGVLGNNDYGLDLPETWSGSLGGVPVAMIHDSGPRAGRAGRMARRFPDAAVVVFGHSHEPCDELGVGGQRLFNPGSATERRRQPRHTYGVLDVCDGDVREHRILAV
jgi:putative phosphoesterase